jgi:hypothetical protein
MKKVNLNSFDDFEHIGQKLKIFSQVGAPLKQNFLNFSRLIGFSPSMDSSASTLQVEKEKVRLGRSLHQEDTSNSRNWCGVEHR